MYAASIINGLIQKNERAKNKQQDKNSNKTQVKRGQIIN